MSKRKKKKVQTPVPRDVSPKNTEGAHKTRQTAIIVALVLVIALVIAIPVYYQLNLAPFRQPVVTVDKTVIDMGYFLKRAKLAGASQASLIQKLVDEQVVKQMAPTFRITVTDKEIDDALLIKASTENFTGNMADNTTGRYLTESEFKDWYRQQLNDTGLSDAEYRDLSRVNLLADKLQKLLAGSIPKTANQIHLNVILTASSADANKAKARIQAGDSFAAVARDVSLDTKSKDQGGDAGWFPPGVLPYDSTIFALDIGAVSNPVAVDSTSPATSRYLLFMVSEKADNREIDGSSFQILQNNALSIWLSQEEPTQNIFVNYDFTNAANQAWVSWQLSKPGK
jgi:hypothetical protein